MGRGSEGKRDRERERKMLTTDAHEHYDGAETVANGYATHGDDNPADPAAALMERQQWCGRVQLRRTHAAPFDLDRRKNISRRKKRR